MPAAEAGRVVVWSAGESILAAPIDAVIEVTDRDADGRARSRHGPLDPVALPGVSVDSADRAVILRAAAGPVALPADRIDGVMPHSGPVSDPPPWLEAAARGWFRGLVRLEDGRIAAVLDPGALRAP